MSKCVRLSPTIQTPVQLTGFIPSVLAALDCNPNYIQTTKRTPYNTLHIELPKTKAELPPEKVGCWEAPHEIKRLRIRPPMAGHSTPVQGEVEMAVITKRKQAHILS